MASNGGLDGWAANSMVKRKERLMTMLWATIFMIICHSFRIFLLFKFFFGISAAKQFTYHIFLFWINFWCIYARQQYIESPLFWTINYILVHSVTYPRHVIPPTITGYSGFGSTGPGLTIDDKQLMVSASRPSVYRHHHTWSSIVEHTKQKRKTNQQ